MAGVVIAHFTLIPAIISFLLTGQPGWIVDKIVLIGVKYRDFIHGYGDRIEKAAAGRREIALYTNNTFNK